jgi:hypothetical protein
VRGNGWDSTTDVDAVVDRFIAVLKRRAAERHEHAERLRV